MSVRTRVRAFGLAAMALGLALVLLPAPSAGAASLAAAGWWSRTSTPLPVNPAAPTAQEGQLVVQGEPSGANAVAALRWTLDEGESSPTLTLTGAPGSVVPPDALILACRAGTPWSEAAGAPLDEGPKVDCSTSVNGVVAEDGTITFALGTLVGDGVLDVVLTPGTTPDGAGSTFSLVFDRPAPDALVTVAGSGDSGSFSGGSSASEFGGESSFSAPSSSGSFSAPSSGDASFSPAPAAEPALPEENQVAMEQPAAEAAQPASSSSADDRDRAKTLGIAVLLAGAAVLALTNLSGAPVVGDGEPAPGGVGRFARPRTGTPPSLS